MRTVRLTNGMEIEIKPLTWEQAKKLKLMSMFSKYADDNAVISEEDMDKVLREALPEDIRSQLTMKDAFEVFSAVLEESMPEKK